MSTTRAMKVTDDVREIRRWVESKGGRPAHVRGTGRGDDPGVLRIDFPGTVSLGSLERMSWDDWAVWFDKKELALVFQPSSRFSRIVPRAEVGFPPSMSATTTRAGGAKRVTLAGPTRQGRRTSSAAPTPRPKRAKSSRKRSPSAGSPASASPQRSLRRDQRAAKRSGRSTPQRRTKTSKISARRR